VLIYVSKLRSSLKAFLELLVIIDFIKLSLTSPSFVKYLIPVLNYVSKFCSSFGLFLAVLVTANFNILLSVIADHNIQNYEITS